ncbi:Re/Si-specific NAD(P)(+) transhydrogenase subunit alpha [Consotaella salsifontis]|uniref:NAD(P) transhydrogenase subunit alpha part 1 n=1 Tax=Consotaella salsifontis TaxID=1365950 RepID=A0A1T4NLM3_9HYPH|nr:NAD(P) transhydrogenase subunit alpha [Consotaella salsifontis]
MKLFVPKERDSAEPRVAASPDTVKKLKGLGFDIVVESRAGIDSRITDEAFTAAGATIGSADDARDADVVLKVRRPTDEELSSYKRGAVVIAIMDPYGQDEAVGRMADAGISAFAMEFMPRITRAQVMDVLSSQANLAGYQAVIDAAATYDRAFPMMMTAAGTVPAARVFVMGAGVAGLQAIATAKRLGAVVSATDVRPAAKEQVESLGGKFIAVEDEEFKQAETAGGYAKEMSKEYQAKQAELVASHIAKQDVVITTALIPGRPAPRLVTRQMVDSMKPGSVLVDLAVERGGNVEGAVAGEVAEVGPAKVVGYLNVPGRIAATASLLYAKNVLAFLETMVDKETKALKLDFSDQLISATALTQDGKVVHPNFQKKAEPAPASAPEAAPDQNGAEPAKGND